MHKCTVKCYRLSLKSTSTLNSTRVWLKVVEALEADEAHAALSLKRFLLAKTADPSVDFKEIQYAMHIHNLLFWWSLPHCVLLDRHCMANTQGHFFLFNMLQKLNPYPCRFCPVAGVVICPWQLQSRHTATLVFLHVASSIELSDPAYAIDGSIIATCVLDNGTCSLASSILLTPPPIIKLFDFDLE